MVPADFVVALAPFEQAGWNANPRFACQICSTRKPIRLTWISQTRMGQGGETGHQRAF
jgi:hypothetical protein